MKPILEVERISKKFLIGHQHLPYLSFRDKLTGLFKPETTKEEFMALRDVSFQVMPGESVGIIGRNGAGKSTLLKILSRITPPSSGHINVRGRIASLLEVGTGFHQELTGRENIFMNGSILGMKSTEIKAKFDEIVDFSGTEKFLDTPLKHYSSGMQLRLAFAVAAHLDPEILIIDEVLAVGDAEFQKKCLGKMEDVSKSGRAILFVSHNLSVVHNLCKRCILLKNGSVIGNGPTDVVLAQYHKELTQYDYSTVSAKKNFYITDFKILNSAGKEIESFNTFDSLTFAVHFTCREGIENFSLAVCFNNSNGVRVTSLWSRFKNRIITVTPGSHVMMIDVPKIKLVPGVYEVIIYADSGVSFLEQIENFKNVVVGFTHEVLQQPTDVQGSFLEEFNVYLIDE